MEEPHATKKPKLSHPLSAPERTSLKAEHEADVAYLTAKFTREVDACRNDGAQIADVMGTYQKILCAPSRGVARGEGLLAAVRMGDARIVRYMLTKGVGPHSRNASEVTPLSLACERGDLDIVQLLYAHGIRISHRFADSKSPLCIAARNGHQELVEWLLAFGMNVDTRDELTGVTPLMAAATTGRLRIVKRLLAAGADATATDNFHNSVRTVSASSGRFAVLAYLVEHKFGKFDKDGKPVNTLLAAVTGGHDQIARYLVEMREFTPSQATESLAAAIRSGNGPIAECLVHQRTDFSLGVSSDRGKSSLYLAIEAKMFDVVRLMFTYGADCNEALSWDGFNVMHALAESGDVEMLALAKAHFGEAIDINEFTAVDGVTDMVSCSPLGVACVNGHVDVVRFLLTEFSDTIDVNRREPAAGALLNLVAEEGNIEIMKLLLASGANVNLPGGNSPLSDAVREDRIDAVRFLCEHGAHVYAAPGEDSPLHQAAEQGQLDTIECLIEEFGADLSQPGVDGLSVLDIALEHVDAVRLLLAHGWDIEAASSTLCHAALRGYLGTVKVLVAHGADINTKYAARTDRWDLVLTPLMAATLGGQLEVVKYLCEQGADLEFASNQNETPIHLAAMVGDIEVFDYLVQTEQVNIEAVDAFGLTPADIAEANENDELLKILEENGVRIDEVPLLESRDTAQEMWNPSSVEHWDRQRMWESFVDVSIDTWG